MNLTNRNLAGLANIFLRRPAQGISLSYYGIGKNDFALSLGARSMLQSVRASSTATAGQPKLDIDDKQSGGSEAKYKEKRDIPRGM